jgi:hypothetical protein
VKAEAILQAQLPSGIAFGAIEVRYHDFFSFFNVFEGMDRKLIQIGGPGVLRVVTVRMIDARCLEEEVTFWGSRAEG